MTLNLIPCAISVRLFRLIYSLSFDCSMMWSFSVRHRLQCLPPLLYAGALSTMSQFSLGSVPSLLSHTCCESVVAVRWDSCRNEYLWEVYLALKASVLPM